MVQPAEVCSRRSERGNIGSAAGLTDNVAGLLAYLFIPAILFL